MVWLICQAAAGQAAAVVVQTSPGGPGHVFLVLAACDLVLMIVVYLRGRKRGR